MGALQEGTARQGPGRTSRDKCRALHTGAAAGMGAWDWRQVAGSPLLLKSHPSIVCTGDISSPLPPAAVLWPPDHGPSWPPGPGRGTRTGEVLVPAPCTEHRGDWGSGAWGGSSRGSAETQVWPKASLSLGEVPRWTPLTRGEIQRLPGHQPAAGHSPRGFQSLWKSLSPTAQPCCGPGRVGGEGSRVPGVSANEVGARFSPHPRESGASLQDSGRGQGGACLPVGPGHPFPDRAHPL